MILTSIEEGDQRRTKNTKLGKQKTATKGSPEGEKKETKGSPEKEKVEKKDEKKEEKVKKDGK